MIWIASITSIALLHPGLAAQPHDAWHAWHAVPIALTASLALASLRARVHRAHRFAYLGALLTLAIALGSPIDAVAESLFAMHMVQHLLLMLVAAPLLALGAPTLMLLWSVPRAMRRPVGRIFRAVWRVLGRPAVAWVAHVASVWAWHAPAAYDAALTHPVVHVVEHATFLLGAVAYWRAIADPRARARLGLGGGLLYLFSVSLLSTALGALLTVATRPWYRGHLATTGPWGLTPLEDQQLAGLLMWIPSSVVYLVAAILLALPRLRHSDAPVSRKSADTVM